MIDASGEVEIKEGEMGGEKIPSGCPVHETISTSRKLTDDEIAVHALTFLLAGYDTTAATLSYTSYLLALNPHIQQKLKSEIDNYFEDKPVSFNQKTSILMM